MPLKKWGLGLLAVLVACSESPQQSGEAQSAKSPIAKESGTRAGFDSTQIRALTSAQVPAKELVPPGKLLEAKQWVDGNGENLLLITRRGPLEEKQTKYTDEESYVELFARQYVQRAGQWQELWHLQDAVRNCPFDMWLGPLPGSTSITDLDGDGQSETTIIYKLTCRSDVSPSNLKIIIHEGAPKYALRGQMVVQYDSVPLAQRVPANSCCLDTISKQQLEAEDSYELYVGRYESEKDFRGAPPEFLRFARQQWRKWITHDQFDQL